MANKIYLADIIEEILDKAEEKLKGETEGEGELEDVEEVVRGEHVRGKPKTPTIWIFTDTVNTEGEPTSMRESWILPLVVVSVVYDSQDARRGQKKATELAAKARSVLLKSRNLDLQGKVHGVRSVTFEPRGRFNEGSGVFSAACVLSVSFTTLE